MAVAAAEGVGGSRYFRLMLSGVEIGRVLCVVVMVATLTAASHGSLAGKIGDRRPLSAVYRDDRQIGMVGEAT